MSMVLEKNLDGDEESEDDIVVGKMTVVFVLRVSLANRVYFKVKCGGTRTCARDGEEADGGAVILDKRKDTPLVFCWQPHDTALALAVP